MGGCIVWPYHWGGGGYHPTSLQTLYGFPIFAPLHMLNLCEFYSPIKLYTYHIWLIPSVCTVKPVLRDHLSWKIRYLFQKVLHVHFNVTEHVTKDHLSWETTNVVFQDRFYCMCVSTAWPISCILYAGITGGMGFTLGTINVRNIKVKQTQGKK